MQPPAMPELPKDLPAMPAMPDFSGFKVETESRWSMRFSHKIFWLKTHDSQGLCGPVLSKTLPEPWPGAGCCSRQVVDCWMCLLAACLCVAAAGARHAQCRGTRLLWLQGEWQAASGS
jgi:hypothetical protein